MWIDFDHEFDEEEKQKVLAELTSSRPEVYFTGNYLTMEYEFYFKYLSKSDIVKDIYTVVSCIKH